jgi:hypothetical protein
MVDPALGNFQLPEKRTADIRFLLKAQISQNVDPSMDSQGLVQNQVNSPVTFLEKPFHEVPLEHLPIKLSHQPN